MYAQSSRVVVCDTMFCYYMYTKIGRSALMCAHLMIRFIEHTINTMAYYYFRFCVLLVIISFMIGFLAGFFCADVHRLKINICQKYRKDF